MALAALTDLCPGWGLLGTLCFSVNAIMFYHTCLFRQVRPLGTNASPSCKSEVAPPASLVLILCPSVTV